MRRAFRRSRSGRFVNVQNGRETALLPPASSSNDRIETPEDGVNQCKYRHRDSRSGGEGKWFKFGLFATFDFWLWRYYVITAVRRLCSQRWHWLNQQGLFENWMRELFVAALFFSFFFLAYSSACLFAFVHCLEGVFFLFYHFQITTFSLALCPSALPVDPPAHEGCHRWMVWGNCVSPPTKALSPSSSTAPRHSAEKTRSKNKLRLVPVDKTRAQDEPQSVSVYKTRAHPSSFLIFPSANLFCQVEAAVFGISYVSLRRIFWVLAWGEGDSSVSSRWDQVPLKTWRLPLRSGAGGMSGCTGCWLLLCVCWLRL